MTITKNVDFSDTTLDVGDIVNLYDMIHLNSVSPSDITVSISVIPSENIDIADYNYDDQFEIISTADEDQMDIGYITDYLEGFGNIGMANTDDDVKLKLNIIGTYTLTFETDTAYLVFELTTRQKEYRIEFKEDIDLSLGTFGSDTDNNTIRLYFDHNSGSRMSDYLDLYDGDTQVTGDSLTSIFANIEYIRFDLSLNNKTLYAGDTYTIELSGTYKISLQVYSSSSYFLAFTNLEVVVAPMSYSSLSFYQPLTPVIISYGSTLPQLYNRFRLGGDATIFAESDFNDEYTVKLINLVTSAEITQSYIPTALPGRYTLIVTFPGMEESPMQGKLVINKASVKIHSDLAESYTLVSDNIDLDTMFYIKTLSGYKEGNETVERIVNFIANDGSSTRITSNIFDPTIGGILAIEATYPGNSVYYSTTRKIYAVIGPIGFKVYTSNKYVFAPSELTTDKKEEVTDEILNTLNIVYKKTNEPVTGDTYDTMSGIISDHTTMIYKPVTEIIPKITFFYTLNAGSVTSRDIVTKTQTFKKLSENLRGDASITLGVKGIKVHPGTSLILTYQPDDTALTVTLPANETGEAYAVDAVVDSVENGVTYVSLPDNIDLTTSNITSVHLGSANFTDLAKLPNGLYKIGLSVKMTSDGDSVGVDSNTYTIEVADASHPNILIADSFDVEMDIMNHLLDKLPESGYDINHLLTEPYFDNDLRDVQTLSLTNYIMGSNYIRVSYKINNVPTSVVAPFIESFDVRPNLTYVAANTSSHVATITSANMSSALDLYYNDTKLASTGVYSYGLPNMIISSTRSNILTWFSNNTITLGTPYGIDSGNDLAERLDIIYENIEGSPPLVDGYDIIQDIVLDTNNRNTARPFWLSMIAKLTTAREELSDVIDRNKSEYFDAEELGDVGEYGLDFSDDADLDAYFESNPNIYTALLANEIDTAILRKHLLTSIIAIRSNVIPTLRIKYAPLVMTASGTVTNGVLTVNVPNDFVGTSGDVTISIAVSVTTSIGSTYQSNTSTIFTSYIYGRPNDATITYRPKTGGSAEVIGVTGDTYDTNNAVVTYGTVTDTLSYTSSARIGTLTPPRTSSVALRLNYATSGPVNISSESTLSITGLTRTKHVQARTARRGNVSVTTTTESISGPAIVTITQQSVTSFVD